MKNLALTVLMLVTIHSYSQQVADFSLTNVITGKTVTLKDYTSSAGVVVIFTSNACPYDNYYYSRIKKYEQEFSGKVPVILVNAHLGENESGEAMKMKASELGWNMPYLADKDQVLMNNLHASKSPEVFVLKNSGGQFTIFYHGALDDNAQVEADVHEAYLTSAIQAMLAGQKPKQSEVRPVGCTIRKK